MVNLSLGSQGESDGRDAMSRKLDAAAWYSAQLLVLAAGNAGSSGVSPESASKNVLSVGAVTDPGVVASFSSHGPTADGRLAPHVVGAGFDVSSTQGGGRDRGYVNASGTSMAAPSVAGVAALVMDRHPDFRGRPEYVRARLMASAVKPSGMLGPTLGINLDNSAGPGELQHEYGLGLVSARTAVAGGDDDDWYNDGDYLSVAADESYYVDIDIPGDAARLDIVLSWIEPPTDPMAAKTVQADLDLYLDAGADCADDACGEHASKSPVDNVEWLIVKEPSAGTHRLKVVPTSDFAGSVKAGVAWTVIRDADTPSLTLSTAQPTVDVDAGSAFEIDLRLGADHYVAAGTTIHLACEGGIDPCSRYADAVGGRSARRTAKTGPPPGSRAVSARPSLSARSGAGKSSALRLPCRNGSRPRAMCSTSSHRRGTPSPMSFRSRSSWTRPIPLPQWRDRRTTRSSMPSTSTTATASTSISPWRRGNRGNRWCVQIAARPASRSSSPNTAPTTPTIRSRIDTRHTRASGTPFTRRLPARCTSPGASRDSRWTARHTCPSTKGMPPRTGPASRTRRLADGSRVDFVAEAGTSYVVQL